ncbi:hypothetical protein GCM10007301_08560 [Azorhizobium oxalatiphilum]|uniref:Uncharacterized protein n=1 Tax=Azorhizobium oxalatiphilum TaxID=980631 RepID=A0A917BM15_9HYPH|nr:hypothetical protein GCM10007301_08560 [Azorhizobium oxalatiphilum]
MGGEVAALVDCGPGEVRIGHDVRCHNLRTRLRQNPDDGAADTTGRARDERNLTIQTRRATYRRSSHRLILVPLAGRTRKRMDAGDAANRPRDPWQALRPRNAARACPALIAPQSKRQDSLYQ